MQKNEKNIICELFIQNFDNVKNKKMVLYGVGPGTKAILDITEQYSIIGLMDEQLTGEFLWGHKIMSWQEVVDTHVEIIVIIANAASTKIINRRIKDKAQENNILVYDLRGSLLQEHNQKQKHTLLTEEYFNQNMDSLKNKIEQYDTISFDIFDTLIMRNVAYPKDIFKIIEVEIQQKYHINIDFVKERIKAERVLMETGEADIYEIYELIAVKNPEIKGIIQDLLVLELEVEKKFIQPRTSMLELYAYACSINKQIYLISDMYIPFHLMKDILTSNEISDYDEVLISCDYKTTKEKGLFEIFKNKSVKGKLLHIGDNLLADIQSAENNGIDAFHILSGRELLEISLYNGISDRVNTINEHIALGLFISKAFDSPFALYGGNRKLVLNSAYDFSYLFFAPLITRFVYWIIDCVEEEGYDCILFSSRDGYLVKKLFDEYQKNISYKKEIGKVTSVYFLTSRSASIMAAIKDRLDISHATEYYSDYPEKMMRERFHLNKEEIKSYSSVKTDSPCDYVLLHKESILAQAERERINYGFYLSTLNLEKYHHIAFVDLMSKGTCQSALRKISDIHTTGLYMYYRKGMNEGADVDLAVKGMYNGSDLYDGTSYFSELFPLLEILLSSPMPTLHSFDQNGMPIYADEVRTTTQIMIMKEMQCAIIDYFNKYSALQTDRAPDSLSLEYVDNLLGMASRAYTDIRMKDIYGEDLVFDNLYEGRNTPFRELR